MMTLFSAICVSVFFYLAHLDMLVEKSIWPNRRLPHTESRIDYLMVQILHAIESANAVMNGAELTFIHRR